MLRRPTDAPAPRGWSLVELVVGLALTGILSTLAWPGYESQLRRLRRADAHAALARLQLAQEQYRSRAAVYASGLDVDGLALPATSEAGHYELSVDSDAASYLIEAIAIGRQADDLACRYLAVAFEHGLLQRLSGPDEALANDADGNRRCWGRW